MTFATGFPAVSQKPTDVIRTIRLPRIADPCNCKGESSVERRESPPESTRERPDLPLSTEFPDIANDRDPAEFDAALTRHDVSVPDEAKEGLVRYANALWGWNEKVNLTRHVGWDDFVGKDLRDVTELARLLAQGERVLDIGSGGGVPGLPLALIRPDLKVELAESVGKKAAILEDLAKACGAKVRVHATRGEAVLDQRSFDVVTCRGVGSLAKLLQWLEGRWDRAGRVLAFKGPKWVEERGEARHRGLLKGLALRKAATYATAGRGGECVILKIARGDAD